MNKKFGSLILTFTIAFVFYGYFSPIPDGFADRFQKGLKLQDTNGVIEEEFGCFAPVSVDWNNDGKKDLIAGQFKEGLIRLYLNRGEDSNPIYKDYQYLKAGNNRITLQPG